MKKLAGLIISSVIIIVCSGNTFSGQGRDDNRVTEKTDIHFTGKYCRECHINIPEKGGDKLLKFGNDFMGSCRCHGFTPGAYIHPVDIVPSEEKKSRIPVDLPLQDGKVTCLTCHDIYLQCQNRPELKKLNRRFLRGAPFLRRTDLCFRCHDERQYKMLDPHNQLSGKGDIVVEKCLYCHLEKPDEKRSTFGRHDPASIHVREVKLIGNLEALCARCHSDKTKLHPINAKHLVEPPEHILEAMEESEEKFGIILPLNYEGRVTCATCHNPHERGVMPGERAAAKGASEKSRLRLPADQGQICRACHTHQFKIKKEGFVDGLEEEELEKEPFRFFR